MATIQNVSINGFKMRKSALFARKKFYDLKTADIDIFRKVFTVLYII